MRWCHERLVRWRHIRAAVETSRGLLVAVLRTGKRKVYAINSLAAARYRHSVSRKKSDPGDALVLANIVRTDMHAHRPLPDDSDLGRRRPRPSSAGRIVEPAAARQPAPLLAARVLPGCRLRRRHLDERPVSAQGT
ncbi:IS110 family transposase [Streptomyces sp. NPDC003996]